MLAPPKRLIDPAKFRDAEFTAKGEPRAHVALGRLKTLWFNTGTLCNITCANCYIESSPRNDRLEYLPLHEVAKFLDEIEAHALPVAEIGLTGGEPFMNPDILPILEAALARGHGVLVLTNAMRPLMRPRIMAGLLEIKRRHGARLCLRVSLDAPYAEQHDAERGAGAFARSLKGLDWLNAQGFKVAIAGRLAFGASEAQMRRAYGELFAARGWAIDASDRGALVLFPEMDETADVPEISTACWGILHKDPADVMCASARMVVKRKGAPAPVVVACTLLPYAPEFELGNSLIQAARPVALNHPHCAKFCVLGGASCSA